MEFCRIFGSLLAIAVASLIFTTDFSAHERVVQKVSFNPLSRHFEIMIDEFEPRMSIAEEHVSVRVGGRSKSIVLRKIDAVRVEIIFPDYALLQRMLGGHYI